MRIYFERVYTRPFYLVHPGITNTKSEVMSHKTLQLNIAISHISLSFVKDLFRDDQGHIQNEISIVEFHDRQTGYSYVNVASMIKLLLF